MAMTLRLSDEETAALRRQAELEGRSMQDIARESIATYIERASSADIAEIVHRNALRYADLLERLRDS
jgi:predicted transcriptional regulator